MQRVKTADVDACQDTFCQQAAGCLKARRVARYASPCNTPNTATWCANYCRPPAHCVLPARLTRAVLASCQPRSALVGSCAAQPLANTTALFVWVFYSNTCDGMQSHVLTCCWSQDLLYPRQLLSEPQDRCVGCGELKVGVVHAVTSISKRPAHSIRREFMDGLGKTNGGGVGRGGLWCVCQ